jgi:hypothetical protein
MLNGRKPIPMPIFMVRSSLEDSTIPKSERAIKTRLAAIRPFFIV